MAARSLLAAMCAALAAFTSCGDGSTEQEQTPAAGSGGNSAASGTGASGGTGGANDSGGAPDARGGIGHAGRAGNGGRSSGGAPSGGVTNAGEAGSASAEAGASGNAGAPTEVDPCVGAQPLASGLVSCTNGFRHRPTPQSCALPARDDEVMGLGGDAGFDAPCTSSDQAACAEPAECTTDADCDDRSYCLFAEYAKAGYTKVSYAHFCQRACQADDDCSADELCTCATATQNRTRGHIVLGVCRPASCRVDADCGDRLLCTAPNYPKATWEYSVSLDRFACQSPDDECLGPMSCPVVYESGCCEAATCLNTDGVYRCSQRDTCDPC